MGVMLLQGCLDGVVEAVAVVKVCVHVADKSSVDYVVGRREVERLDPDVVVTQPHEEAMVFLHRSKCLSACNFHEEHHRVPLVVVPVIDFVHFFDVFLDVDFVVRDIARFDECSGRGVSISGEEVEGFINLLVLDEEGNKKSLEMKRRVVTVFRAVTAKPT
jgi:hypothetical protein